MGIGTTGTALLFDLGGVLVDWDARYFYRKVFDDETAMERFLAEVCDPEWNRSIDAGKPFATAVAERQAQRPEYHELIGFWHSHWTEMLREAIPGTVAILRELKDLGHPLYALTNWSAETFPIAQARFDFLDWFSRIVVSGQVGLAKPDPRIFTLALSSCGLDPARTLFIDDSRPNVEVALALGMEALHFQDPGRLREDLVARGLLGGA
jgi:2-haloacid dehalogenase